MEGKKYIKPDGSIFICDEVVTKNGKTYIKNGYMLWHESLVKPEGEVKQENDKSQKVYKKSKRVRKVSRDIN